MDTEQAQESEVRDDANAEERNRPIEESGEVERIRDILFGWQMRDYDVRFQSIDERLVRESAEARADVKQRLEALENVLKGEVESLKNRLNTEQSERGMAAEKLGRDLGETANFLKGELESLKNRLNTEQSERGMAVEKLGRDLGETANALELKIKSLDERAAHEIHDLRQQLLEQSKALSAEIKEKHDQMQAGLNREAEQIRGAMTGREALAEMLSEVAHRLKNAFRTPGA
jgi:hypothetical protein